MNKEFTKHINEQADLLVEKLKIITNIKSSENSFKPDVPTQKIDTKNVQIRVVRLVNEIGDNHGIYFEHEQKLVGFIGNDYISFVKLIETIFKKREFLIFSFKTLEEILFNWSELQFKNKANTTFAEHLLLKTKNLVSDYEIWIPISSTFIECPITLGNVEFRELTKELFENTQIQMTEKPSNEMIKIHFDELKEKYQGRMVAITKIRAEHKRAVELSLIYVEQSISLLRLFSPSAFRPEVKCLTNIVGYTHPKTETCFTVLNNSIVNEVASLKDGYIEWKISKQDIKAYNTFGLRELHRLLVNKKSKLEDKLIDCLLLFSKSTLTDNYSDKIVYITVSLESMFLKDQNENISDNIAKRIAWLIGKNLEQRKEIIRIIKGGYGLRSKFLHHGESISDKELFINFIQIVHDSLFKLLYIRNINSKEELLNYLDDRMLS